MSEKTGLILRSEGANGFRAKTRIFNIVECGVKMVVLQRLVLANIGDTEHFVDYKEIKSFKDKKLLRVEMVFYKKSFDLLIGGFLNEFGKQQSK